MTLFSSKMYQAEVTQKLNRDIAEQIVQETQLMQGKDIDHDELKNLFHQLMIFNPSIELYLVDPEGKLLAFSAPAGSVKRKQVDLTPIRAFLDGQFTFPLTGDDPKDLDRKKVFSVAKVKNGDQLECYLYIILGGEQVDNAMQLVQGSYILKLSLAVLVAGLIFSLLTGFSFFTWLTRRLQRLSIAMDAYKSGVKPEAIHSLQYNPNGDEIDDLTQSFHNMADTIQDQVERLQNTDNLRRELVANVSHDLRTPLATLQGYIETLLIKKDNLSDEERKSYLQTALNHCAHLNKLVEQLFELAKFDAQEIKPQTEAFNLSELVQDVLQKFQLPAQDKKIVLSANIEKALPFACADISLIERVLDNLIENALRHTPQGGSVNIVLAPDGGQIAVKISDTGYGIPDTDLPHIFDRFFQQEKSRSKQSHSGLGLAIVKRIIELHNSQINVVSNLNKGSTFSFRLPSVV